MTSSFEGARLQPCRWMLPGTWASAPEGTLISPSRARSSVAKAMLLKRPYCMAEAMPLQVHENLMSVPGTSGKGQAQASTRAIAGASPDRILVVRLRAMGDIIHGMPAIAALRRAKPELKIGWLIEQRWRELLCSRKSERLAARSQLKPLADWVHVANFSSWRHALSSDETWGEIRLCFREVRAMKYELTLDLQGAMRSALAARATGARLRVGSSQPREAPASMFYTRAIDPRGTHVVEHALAIASAVAGEPLEYIEPPFPQDPVHETWAEDFVAKF